jgi:hypothetical protein
MAFAGWQSIVFVTEVSLKIDDAGPLQSAEAVNAIVQKAYPPVINLRPGHMRRITGP